MADEVYMDIPVVQRIADSFGSFSDTLKGVSKTMEAAMNVLKATAFVGLVGGTALDRYLSIIKPNVDKLAEKMNELQGDVNGAIRAYRDGDYTGSRRFS
jgi:uncharacterized protein YoxC